MIISAVLANCLIYSIDWFWTHFNQAISGIQLNMPDMGAKHHRTLPKVQYLTPNG